MNRLWLVGLGCLLLSTSADAARWTKPGWYQITDGLLGLMIYDGPYEDEDTCRRTLPKGSNDSWFTCDYIYERPSFDD